MRIALTGFGPFGNFSTNPSEIIVDGLKEVFDFEGIDLITKIVDVDYEEAQKCLEWVVDVGSDFAVHLGVQPTPWKLMLESRSFNYGYILQDVNGSVPLMNCCKVGNERKSELETDVDCEKIKQSVTDLLDNDMFPLQIEVSNNPGRYLCAYIYYSSLSVTNGRSIFVHIPPLDDNCTANLLIRILKQILIAIYKIYNKTENV